MYLVGQARTRVVAPPALRAGWVLADEARAIRAVGAGPALAAVLRAARGEAPADPPGVVATGPATARLHAQLAAVLAAGGEGMDAAFDASRGLGPVGLGVVAVELAGVLAAAGWKASRGVQDSWYELVRELVAADGDERRLELVAALFGDDEDATSPAAEVLRAGVAALAVAAAGLDGAGEGAGG